MPGALLVALVLVPAALLAILRVNAALVFLALCLGDVLVQFCGGDAVSIVIGASVGMNTTASILRLILLLGPAVLTILFMIGTVHGHKRAFNLLPSIGVGLLTALLAVPLLPAGLAHNVVRSNLWSDAKSFESGIVAFSALVCLIFLWMQRPKHGGGKEGKKHK